MRVLYGLIHGRFTAGGDVSRVQVAEVLFYVREAELWLARNPG